MKGYVKNIFLFLCVILLSIASFSQTSSYIHKYTQLAKKLSQEYEIPACVILGVAIIESGAGKSKNAKLLNNHFGIVGKNNLHKHPSKAKSRYKEYASIEDSYKDFCRHVSTKKFYTKLKGEKDCKKWITAISKTGYSTMPATWEKKVSTTIVTHHLDKIQ